MSGKQPLGSAGIRLEVFKHLLASIADEMGVVLKRASYSPNIKERRDFSCAVFNANGLMVAQAAHIPVHLGSMPLSVASALKAFTNPMTGALDLEPGDSIALNDPFQGGTHLPDITLITPVFISRSEPSGTSLPALAGFVASRAHHADVGGMTAGSMPVAREIFQEGLIIPPVKLYQAGSLNRTAADLILANVRTPVERAGDLWAQYAANQRGAVRLLEMVQRYGLSELSGSMTELLAYAERLTRSLLARLPDGVYTYQDELDDDGLGSESIPIRVSIEIRGDHAVVDFSGSAPQQKGGVNAVYAITLSAVHYVFRCLLGLDAPNNSGCLMPIVVIAPEGSIVNARSPAAVAGGNVETSQRIVDVLLGALFQACPECIPAASQGTMNNITIGGFDTRRFGSLQPYTYYETIGGGMGALSGQEGSSALHSHMTNTLNTPVEALEFAYPLRIVRYAIRHGSGGRGRWRGGDGITRELQVLESSAQTQATLFTERRRGRPYGLGGGEPGQPGENILIRQSKELVLPAKGTIELQPGDILSIRTPGGGGYGPPQT